MRVKIFNDMIYPGKAANGKEEKEVDHVNSPPAWAWADLAGWSGSRIRNLERLDPDLQLENAHLGRGRDFYDVEVPYI